MLTSTQLEDLNALIDGLSKSGQDVPTSVSQLPDFPYSDFSDLMADFKAEAAWLLRFSYAMDPSLLSLLGSRALKLKSNIGMLLAYGGPVVALVLCFVFSWWFLVAIPICLSWGMSLTKKAYNSAIFDAAFSDEVAFCFLYFIGQVSLRILGTDGQFYYKQDDTPLTLSKVNPSPSERLEAIGKRDLQSGEARAEEYEDKVSDILIARGFLEPVLSRRMEYEDFSAALFDATRACFNTGQTPEFAAMMHVDAYNRHLEDPDFGVRFALAFSTNLYRDAQSKE